MTDSQHPDLTQAARRWFAKAPDALSDRERRVLRHAATRQTVSRNTNLSFDDKLTLGEKLADQVASFGGSWRFVMGFGAFLALWVGLNLLLLRSAFDPYPFIFLNLILSTLAAIQAPLIMMSQNRLAVKDRHDAAHDYEVNLKAEIEIMALHDKLDQLRTEGIETMLRKQEEQIALLTRLVQQMPPPTDAV
jgi:uncharacterized membrane protein|tara:strand:+ start:1862 stop:2434 length:573 start_codon:yes stop_codon:yes gene_type:complete